MDNQLSTIFGMRSQELSAEKIIPISQLIHAEKKCLKKFL